MSEWRIIDSGERTAPHECRMPSRTTVWLWRLREGAVIECRGADPEVSIKYAGERRCGRRYELCVVGPATKDALTTTNFWRPLQ